MNAIGGYFELELSRGAEYHQSAIALNTGRNAFEYILESKGYSKVYLPYYTCDVMLEPINKLDIDVDFYSIDVDFFPQFDFDKVNRDEVFVYTNYFGLCDHNVKNIALICSNLIIDNSQSFYSQPIEGVDTFYSARKFFGVSDGAYLYTDKRIERDLEKDLSYTRFAHLLGRIDMSAEDFYLSFKENDKGFKNQDIKEMSSLTHRLLSSIDYNYVANKRLSNFRYLHSILRDINKINLPIDYAVPMIYPLLIDEGEEIKEFLIKNKVFVPTYWPNVIKWCEEKTHEYEFSKNIVMIPIDQRYNTQTMDVILTLLFQMI